MSNAKKYITAYAEIGGEVQNFSTIKSALCAAYGARQVFGDSFKVVLRVGHDDIEESSVISNDRAVMTCRQIRSVIDIAVTECTGVDHNTMAQICASRLKFLNDQWLMPDAELTPRKWWDWVEAIFGPLAVIRYFRIISESLGKEQSA